MNTRQTLIEARRWFVRWLLFFLISLGLGYAAVQRYDPRTTPGLSDANVYFRMVGGEDVQGREMRFRVLVPWVAKPFYALARKFLDTSRAVNLALLISNSIFCATSGCLLVAVGWRVTGNLAVALLGATLYLLNFAVMNLQLAAMVDAGEACLILAVIVTLFAGRWWLLPLWGLLGALAKETFLPLAGVLALVWWYVEFRKSQDKVRRLLPILVMLSAALATIVVVRSRIAGTMVMSDMLVQTHAVSGNASRLSGVLFSPTFWYVFIWLLPLGLMRLKRLPRPWVYASVFSALAALVLGVYRDVGGNVARPMFDVLGPLLSLSAAIFLTGFKSSPDHNV
jgi:hypothetical protein